MAETGFSTSSNLRKEVQSANILEWMGDNSFFFGLAQPKQKGAPIGGFDDGTMGVEWSTGEDSIVQLKQDFVSAQGDKLTVPLMRPLQGEGLIGDARFVGNAEALAFYDYSLELKKVGHSIEEEGELSNQRVEFKLRNQFIPALKRWAGEKVDSYVLAALSGLASADTNIAAVAPSTNRKVYGGETTAGVVNTVSNDASLVTATHLMGPNFLKLVKRKAIAANPKVRPIMVKGKKYYVAFLHPMQIKALQQNDDWEKWVLEAESRGKDHPIFTGAQAVIGGIIIHEWERIETRAATESFESGDAVAASTNVARGLFCGAQAVIFGFGRKPKIWQKWLDMGQIYSAMLDMILMCGKPRFNSEDYGVITMDTTIEWDS